MLLPRLPVLRATVVAVSSAAAVATLVTGAGAAESVTRVSGPHRVATSVEVARAGWDTAEQVLLATSVDYPDAVAAAALAATRDAPVLLTDPAKLSPAVADVLDDLGARSVTILGGGRAVSPDVATQLRDLDLRVDRVHGATRFETAARVARLVADDASVDTVAVALGRHASGRDAWPDALSAATLAGGDVPAPTLLSGADTLPEATRRVLEDLHPDRVVLLGGATAVSESVRDEVEGLGLDVERVRGPDRYATSVAVAAAALEDGKGLSGDRILFTSGEDFADALSAGALAARWSAPLVLVPSEVLADVVDAFVRDEATTFGRAVLVGGPAAVTDHVKGELVAALGGEPRPAPPAPCPPNSSPDCRYTYEHPIETWERLAQCESGGDWSINTGNGFYGGLQFSLSSWRSVGGSDYPHQHDRWEQIHRGERLHDRQGWSAWPSCSRALGLR